MAEPHTLWIEDVIPSRVIAVGLRILLDPEAAVVSNDEAIIGRLGRMKSHSFEGCLEAVPLGFRPRREPLEHLLFDCRDVGVGHGNRCAGAPDQPDEPAGRVIRRDLEIELVKIGRASCRERVSECV